MTSKLYYIPRIPLHYCATLIITFVISNHKFRVSGPFLLFLQCSDYDNSYSFRSPTDDWPSMSTDVDESSKQAVQQHMRRGPLKSIRRVAGGVAGRFRDILVQ